MRRYFPVVVLFIILALYPQEASANSGTPLMLSGMAHLLVGNILIGILEGLLLCRFYEFERTQGDVIGTMILANYFSTWAGFPLLRIIFIDRISQDLYNAWTWYWVFVLFAWGMTVLLEWPFVIYCLKGVANRSKVSLKASLLVQSISYGLIFSFYWISSGTTLYTETKIVRPSDMSLSENVVVYYLDEKNGNVYSSHLSGGDKKIITKLPFVGHNNRLYVRQSQTDKTRWDLRAYLEGQDTQMPVLTNMIFEAVEGPREKDADGDAQKRKIEGTFFNFGPAPKLAVATNSNWEFTAGFWAFSGLTAINKKEDKRIWLSYETPFNSWFVRNAVHLPDDKVLFQLGENQICIFDPQTKEIAMLWHGKGPVAVIQENKSLSPK